MLKLLVLVSSAVAFRPLVAPSRAVCMRATPDLDDFDVRAPSVGPCLCSASGSRRDTRASPMRSRRRIESGTRACLSSGRSGRRVESGTRARLSSGCSGRRDASSPGRTRRSQAPVEASAAAGNVVTANDPQLEGKTPNELDDMLDECEVPKGGVIPKECIDFD